MKSRRLRCAATGASGGVDARNLRVKEGVIRKHFTLYFVLINLILFSGCGGGAPVNRGGEAATEFRVTAQAASTAGASFTFTVAALDASGNVATGYSGTVKFTSTDAQALLPPTSSLTAGQGSFSVTLKTPGDQTITVTDVSVGSITGSSSSISVSASNIANYFSLATPAAVTVGIPFNVTVIALDSANAVATSYSGTANFTSSDGQAVLPSNTPIPNGYGSIQVTFNTVGPQTITATDTVSASLTGTSSLISADANAAAQFSITAPIYVENGSQFSLAVTALDTAGNVDFGYAGTLHFTSTDTQAVLPADGTLSMGMGTFESTLTTAGSQTITATDVSAASITGISNPVGVSSLGALTIISAPPPDGSVGTGYGYWGSMCGSGPMLIGFELVASEGGESRRTHFTWSGSSMPPGLTVDAIPYGNGTPQCPKGTIWVIDGAPTTAGTYEATISVSDGTTTASKTYSIVITAERAASRKKVTPLHSPAGLGK